MPLLPLAIPPLAPPTIGGEQLQPASIQPPLAPPKGEEKTQILFGTPFRSIPKDFTPTSLKNPKIPNYPELMSKIKLDLHPIFNKGDLILDELSRVIHRAAEKGIDEVEIIPGKGKKRKLMDKVKKFLNRKDIRPLYHRIKVDPKNHGRLFVYFRS